MIDTCIQCEHNSECLTQCQAKRLLFGPGWPLSYAHLFLLAVNIERLVIIYSAHIETMFIYVNLPKACEIPRCVVLGQVLEVRVGLQDAYVSTYIETTLMCKI